MFPNVSEGTHDSHCLRQPREDDVEILLSRAEAYDHRIMF